LEERKRANIIAYIIIDDINFNNITVDLFTMQLNYKEQFNYIRAEKVMYYFLFAKIRSIMMKYGEKEKKVRRKNQKRDKRSQRYRNALSHLRYLLCHTGNGTRVWQ
jgi:hypothetical protein